MIIRLKKYDLFNYLSYLCAKNIFVSNYKINL